MGLIPTVTKEEAVKFATHWNFKGVAIPLDDVACQFATDFANVTLRSFIDYCNKQAMAAIQKAKETAESQAAKVTLE